MTIARGAQVIFIDVDKYSKRVDYDAGYKLDSDALVNLILEKVDQYAAKVLFLSIGDIRGIYNTGKFQNVLQKGVYLITSVGNSGTMNPNFPVNRTEFRSIGSVDHEDRKKYLYTVYIDGKPLDIYDWDYYSAKWQFSGTSEYGLHNCPDAPLTLCSSYGANSIAAGTSFVLPGNGVPIYTNTYNEGIHAVYGVGTSYSTPYFAAMILVFLYAYKIGWMSKNPDCPIVYPSPDQIDDWLKTISSQSAWDQKMGWGWFTLNDLYPLAFTKGFVEAPNQSTGGGASGGFYL